MLVHGEVVAGIDILESEAGRCQSGKAGRFNCTFPRRRCFAPRIDSAKTRVYSRQTGLLVTHPTRIWKRKVRQEAERQLQEAALADGILRQPPSDECGFDD